MRRLFRLWRLSGRDLRVLWMALRHPDRPRWLVIAAVALAFFALEPHQYEDENAENHASRGIMQAAVGHRSCNQPVKAGHDRSRDFEQPFDLDRSIERKRRDADGGAGMPAFVAEHLDH